MDHHSSHRSVKVTIPPVSVGIAHLQYDAASERISGWIGTEHFNERAFSGGSRGHKTVGVKLAKEYLHDQENTLQSRWNHPPGALYLSLHRASQEFQRMYQA